MTFVFLRNLKVTTTDSYSQERLLMVSLHLTMLTVSGKRTSGSSLAARPSASEPGRAHVTHHTRYTAAGYTLPAPPRFAHGAPNITPPVCDYWPHTDNGETKLFSHLRRGVFSKS